VAKKGIAPVLQQPRQEEDLNLPTVPVELTERPLTSSSSSSTEVGSQHLSEEEDAPSLLSTPSRGTFAPQGPLTDEPAIVADAVSAAVEALALPLAAAAVVAAAVVDGPAADIEDEAPTLSGVGAGSITSATIEEKEEEVDEESAAAAAVAPPTPQSSSRTRRRRNAAARQHRAAGGATPPMLAAAAPARPTVDPPAVPPAMPAVVGGKRANRKKIVAAVTGAATTDGCSDGPAAVVAAKPAADEAVMAAPATSAAAWASSTKLQQARRLLRVPLSLLALVGLCTLTITDYSGQGQLGERTGCHAEASSPHAWPLVTPEATGRTHTWQVASQLRSLEVETARAQAVAGSMRSSLDQLRHKSRSGRRSSRTSLH